MRLADRVVVGAWLGLAGFGLLAQALLTFGASVPPWIAPTTIGLPILLAAAARDRHAAAPDPDRSTKLAVAAWIVLAVVFGALAYGSVATTPRHWDGATGWFLRTRALTDAPTLAQTFFVEPGVYTHSGEYPLLWSLLQASIERCVPGFGGIAMTLWFALLVATAATTWRAVGVDVNRRTVLLVALTTTPMFIAPTSGAVDSGFGDAALATCVTGMFAGILRGSPWLAFAAAAVAVLIKPEGCAYPIVIGTAVWLRGGQREFTAIAVGWAAAAALWMPAYAAVSRSGAATGGAGAILAVVIAGLAILIRQRTDRDPAGRRRRAWTLALGTALAAGALVLGPALPLEGVLRVYVDGGQSALRSIPELPGIVTGLLGEMLEIRKFGLTFALLLVAAWVVRRRGGTDASATAGLALGLGLAFLIVPFWLSAEELGHHLRSSADRLLLHWVGPTWLLLGAAWERAAATPDAMLAASCNEPTP